MPTEDDNVVVKTVVENKKVNWWKVLASLILIVFGFTVMWGVVQYKTKITEIENNKLEATKITTNLNEALTGANDLLQQKTIELDKLKNQIAGIKDRDDLLKRDIEIYIKTTHQKVPRIVAKTIAHQVVTLSKKYKVSPEIVLGIIKVESTFNPMSVGPKTRYGFARGLMQVMPEWVKKLGLKSHFDLHNIDIGIETGIKVFLIHVEEEDGDISAGLYKYVNKDRTYVAKVYAAMGKFVAFRSTIDEESQNVETDIESNGNSKKEKGVKISEEEKKNNKRN